MLDINNVHFVNAFDRILFSFTKSISMYSLIKSLLFQLDEEQAHHIALSAVNYAPQFLFSKPTGTPVNAFGMQFPHAIGLAAGLDKNGDYLDALAKLGFAFIELGTVTPKPQAGNPKPRLFRLPEVHGIINRMGFNNHGVDVLVNNLSKASYDGILGINIGKNKDTPIQNATDDYIFCLQKVYQHASYVTINISSPNTPDLRQLQQGEYFNHLLTQLQIEQQKLAQRYKNDIPLLVKISPDESEETLKQMTDVIIRTNIKGIIATNTSCDRDMLPPIPFATEQGGLSGRPLRGKSNQCLQLLKRLVGDEVTLIGVGGIDSPEAAQQRLDAGASLLQIYSGLIYEGPGLVARLVNELS